MKVEIPIGPRVIKVFSYPSKGVVRVEYVLGQGDNTVSLCEDLSPLQALDLSSRLENAAGDVLERQEGFTMET